MSAHFPTAHKIERVLSVGKPPIDALRWSGHNDSRLKSLGYQRLIVPLPELFMLWVVEYPSIGLKSAFHIVCDWVCAWENGNKSVVRSSADAAEVLGDDVGHWRNTDGVQNAVIATVSLQVLDDLVGRAGVINHHN